MFKKNRNTYQFTDYRQKQATNRCGCVDALGKPKKWYANELEAKKAQEFIMQENGVEVTIYKCPKGKGYHLTKSE